MRSTGAAEAFPVGFTRRPGWERLGKLPRARVRSVRVNEWEQSANNPVPEVSDPESVAERHARKAVRRLVPKVDLKADLKFARSRDAQAVSGRTPEQHDLKHDRLPEAVRVAEHPKAAQAQPGQHLVPAAQAVPKAADVPVAQAVPKAAHVLGEPDALNTVTDITSSRG